MFHEQIRKAQVEGRLGSCTCWDCIRAIGLTPPFTIRDKHKEIYPAPPRAYNEAEPGVEHGDPGGVPLATPRKRERQAETKAKERAHLREAVRNREAI